MASLRIALLTDVAFWLRDRGDRLRIDALWRFLATRWTVDVVFVGDPTLLASIGELSDYRGIQIHSAGDPEASSFLGKRWSRLWKSRNKSAVDEPKLSDFRSKAIGRRVAAVCKTLDPEFVIVEYIRLAYLEAELRPVIPDAIWAIDTLDVMCDRCRNFHESGERHWVDISEQEEREALGRFDTVFAIQEEDQKRFQSMLPNSSVMLLGHASPVKEYDDHNGETVDVLFLGSQGAPNRLALRDFLREVWPHVHQACSGARLRIIGHVGKSVRAQAPACNVVCEGYVADLSQAYYECDIVINPVIIGGGLKIKTVEALCNGKPLVTTTMGAQGLSDGAGSAFLVFDDSVEMGAALVRLIGDEGARRQLGQEARRFAKNRFSEHEAFGELAEFINMRCRASVKEFQGIGVTDA
jgi:glycosyltransferase involved in cell wall biosynthesis